MSARWQDPTHARREADGGARRRIEEQDEIIEDARLTPLGVTLAFVALVALMIGAVSCDPADSPLCMNDTAECVGVDG